MELTYETVRNILHYHFWIPSFQRGYRWQKNQIENLLNDLAESKKEQSNIPYCLQPLVVKKDEDRFAVIDGQQRLTTIYLVLKALAVKELFSIAYEDRPESAEYFDKLEKDDCCPDFYYIYQAYRVIKDWFEKHKNSDKLLTQNDILDKAQFIWYQTEEDPYDVFCRLNSGKIALSNAELTKALILTASDVPVVEIASEWDFMEQTLQNDNFWYFINPDAENIRYAASRIDFIIELLLRLRQKEEKQKEDNFDLEEIKRNPSYLFEKIESEKEKPLKTWIDIRDIFRRISSWYEDRDMYHLIGYFVNRKGSPEDRTSHLVDLIDQQQKKTSSEFKEYLRQGIKNFVLAKKIATLNYQENRNELNNILLLFNIALLNRQNSVQSRYPFADHQKSRWSLEHIHAKKERPLDEKDIRKIAKISLGQQYPEEDTVEVLIEKFKKQNAPLLEIIKRDGEWFLNDSEEVTHGLENLALLNCSNNSAFNNGLFMEKKALLAQWEGGENMKENTDSSFVPLGTKMVFFKHFSPHSSVPYLWTSRDGDLYLASIKRYLAAYLKCDENAL